MKNLIKYLSIVTLVVFTFSNYASASSPAFVDFNKVLNESIAGSKAQQFLKNKLESEIKKYNKLEKDIRKEENQIISQKKLISNEEYQKKVKALRAKVAKMQKEKRETFNSIGKMRNKAKADLLKVLNPIIKKYMEDNKIRIVLDKSSILLGDSTLDITEPVINNLNKDLKTLKLN
jgi:Skp family chaperone for outer membrane proteins